MKTEIEIREKIQRANDDILFLKNERNGVHCTPAQREAIDNLIGYDEIEISTLRWVLGEK